MNFNYENLKSMKNLMEMSFLNKDVDQILNDNDINKKFKKIMSIYEIMENREINSINFEYNDDQINENQININSEDKNEIEFNIKLEQIDVNKTIYFLDNTNGKYNENDILIQHNHDNLKEMNESNITLFINGKQIPFKKSFILAKNGIYLMKLILKNKF